MPAVRAVYGSEAVTEHLSFTPRSVEEVRGIVARAREAARAPLNTASARTLLAAGFTEEGRIRAWRDSVTYGILREEWDGAAVRRR